MKKYSITERILVILLPIITVTVLYFAAVFVAKNVTLPRCLTYKYFGIYCPGCGMTRSVIALLHGDILLSLRNNALIIFGILLLLAIYLELVFKAFGKRLRFPIHSNKFIIGTLILIGVYSVLRNFIPFLAPI
ncbi:MAG: DUF2752 domain-containing protein [Ruminococcus sp.]|nr:DUF2752 domain-containing protein [Ruminococcus sp.]